MTEQPEVRENVAEHRFEIWLGDEMAGFTAYQPEGQASAFLHTQIDRRFGGQGLGSVLIESALSTAGEQGVKVLPYCPFVKSFIQKHPDYLGLVPPARRRDFGLPQVPPVES